MSTKKLVMGFVFFVGLVALLVKSVFLVDDLELSQRLTMIGVVLFFSVGNGFLLSVVERCFIDDEEDDAEDIGDYEVIK